MSDTCMGGWCAVRDRCKHYQAKTWSRPIERMCEPKTTDAFQPVPRAVIPIQEEQAA